MKFRARLSLVATILILAFVVMGCPPVPDVPTPPEQDGGIDAEPDADQPDSPPLQCNTPAECVCATYVKLQCKDEIEYIDTCVETAQDIIISRIIPFDPDCIIKSTTKEQVRKCPGVRCL